MRIGKVVGIIVLVVIGVVVGVAAYLINLDVDAYRDDIALAAEDATGRELKLEGPLSLTLSLSPTVSGEGISLANAAWGSRPEMLKLTRFEVQLQLLPLLFGDMQIDRLILIEPDILLETDAKGRGNWQFETAKAGQAPAGDGGGPGALPQIARLLIEKGLLTYRDGATGQATVVRLDRIEAAAASTEAPLDLAVRAAFNDLPFTIDGSIGPLKSAFGGAAPLNLDLTAAGLGLTAKLKGTAQAAAGSLDADIDVSAANLSGLKPLAGDGLPADLPLKLAAHAAASPAGAKLTGLKLTLGNSDLAGDASVALGGARPKLTADLQGKRLDLGELRPSGDKAETAAAKDDKPATKVFPSEPLPLDGLKALDADAKLKLGEVVAPPMTLRDLTLAAKLSNGRLELKPAGVNIAGSPVQLSATLDAGRKVPSVALDLNAKGFDVGRLLTETKTTDLVQGKGDLVLKLSGQGASVAAIMGSLNGGSSLLMNEGKVKTKALDTAVGGLTAVVGMMSGEKTEWTVLNCVASRFAFRRGIATSQGMLADTEYSTVIGEGNVDLGKEALALKVSPQAKSATLNVAVPIKIGGSFTEPSFRPDELATARRLGGLLGAAIFPPAALLALGDMGTGEDNPCLKIAKGGGKKAAAPAAAGSTTPKVEEVKSAVEDKAKGAVESVTKGLKSLFGSKKD